MLERNDMILRDERYANAPLAAYTPQRPMFGPPPVQDDEEPNLLASIFRHAWVVVLVLAVSMAAACIYLNRAQPLYQSTAKIYIEPARGGGEMATMERSGYLFTQGELIKSTPMLSMMLERPEVKGLAHFSEIPNQIMYLRDYLEAEVGRRDDVISVSVQTPHAEESAIIVNALVQTFIADREARANKLGATYLTTLEKQEKEAKAELDQARQRISELMRSDPNLRLSDSSGNNPVVQRMMAASQALTTVNLQILTLEQTYGPNSRQVQQLRAQADVLDQDYRTAKVEALKTSDKRQEIEALRLVEQDLIANLTPLRSRIQAQQVDVDRQRQVTPVQIVESGQIELYPSHPKKKNTLALAGVIGVVLGAGLALLRDRMDTRLRSIEEVQNIVGLPILGTVPRMPGRRTAVARAMAVHLDPRSEVAEAYRTIRTAVYFSGQGAGNRAKTLLVTSPEPGDGKTTSASNLAIAIAQTGRNILLLDADFRKPTQHKNLDVKDTVGLSSVLAGIETLDRAIQRTGVDGLDILPCGPIPENPSEILNSQEFGELIDRLAMKYDHILFDSPPANLVTDARILGAVCDATILVLRAEKSTRKAAEHARNALLSVGARVLGAVVNDVPRGKGYEVYGGSYYGTPEMRSRTSPSNVARLPRPASEVSE
jgi:capsular exopolysaccharide synthesis family protein